MMEIVKPTWVTPVTASGDDLRRWERQRAPSIEVDVDELEGRPGRSKRHRQGRLQPRCFARRHETWSVTYKSSTVAVGIWDLRDRRRTGP